MTGGGEGGSGSISCRFLVVLAWPLLLLSPPFFPSLLRALAVLAPISHDKWSCHNRPLSLSLGGQLLCGEEAPRGKCRH